MKRKLILSLLIGLSVCVIGLGCKKENANTTLGEFVTEEADAYGRPIGTGIKYKGICMRSASYDCTGKNDVSIAHNNGSNSVMIYNMPSGSSGVFNVPEVTYGMLGSCHLYILVSIGGINYHSYSGTLTKTSERTFEFDIKMKKASDGKIIRNIIGNGKY